MSSIDSSFKKGPSKYLTADKTDYNLSPSRLQINTTAKSQITHNDDKKTTHKRSLNFCKGQAEQILKESQKRLQMSLQSSRIWQSNNQNQNLTANFLAKTGKNDEIQFLNSEHRVEIQKLLLEISRLHDVIYDLQKMKKNENQKIREQLQHITLLQLNNIRQSHSSQIDILESTLKKTRDSLAEKTDEYEDLLKEASREKQMFKKQIQSLRSDLKELVDKKNDELYSIRQENESKIREVQKERNQAIEEMRQTCERQFKKFQKELEEKDFKIGKLVNEQDERQFRYNEIEEQMKKEKEQLEYKLESYIQQNHIKYENLTIHINEMLERQAENSESRQVIQRQIFESQINNLLKIIRVKDEESQKMKTYYQMQYLQTRMLRQNQEQEMQALRSTINRVQQNNLRDLQQLKVKMAYLHQNDLKELVKLYQTKIQGLNKEIINLEEDAARHRKYMHEETHRWFEHKKNYQTKISQLNSEILRMRSGMGVLEKQMKDRFESERSAMLLTSRNLIQGAELKNTNSKFHEDELRKLRYALEKKEQEIQHVTTDLNCQIDMLVEENKSLNGSLKKAQKEQKDLQHEYLTILEQKCEQIKKLNRITHQLMEDNQQTEGQEVKQLRFLAEEQQAKLEKKGQLIKDLHIKIDKLEKDLHDVKVQNQHLYLENQINHEEAKSEYEKVANENMSALKKFYERRMKQLESDVQLYRNKLHAEGQNMNQLIKRYKTLEEGMKRMVKQAKKRSVLEQKLINLGLDDNLVKNKAELFQDKQ